MPIQNIDGNGNIQVQGNYNYIIVTNGTWIGSTSSESAEITNLTPTGLYFDNNHALYSGPNGRFCTFNQNKRVVFGGEEMLRLAFTEPNSKATRFLMEKGEFSHLHRPSPVR